MKNYENTVKISKEAQKMQEFWENKKIDDKFALEAWKVFDRYVRTRLPKISTEHRYLLCNSFDETIFNFIKRVQTIEQTFYKK